MIKFIPSFLIFLFFGDIFILNLLDRLSIFIASKIGKNDSEDDKEVYAFSIHMILSEILFNLIWIPISILLGVLPEYIIVLLIFYFTRRFIGGFHAPTETMCILTSSIIFALNIVLSRLFLDDYIVWYVISGICYVIIFNKIPVFGKHTIDRGKEANERFKNISFRNFIIIYIINSILVSLTKMNWFDFSLYSSVISFSMMSTVFLATSFSERFFDLIYKESE